MRMNTITRRWPQPVPIPTPLKDRVVLSILLLLTVLAVLHPPLALESARFMGTAFFRLAPYFLLAIAFAATAKASGMDQLVARVFSGNRSVAIFLAAAAGALSPFCSCGVIPLIAAMLVAGVPLAPVMAFCIASPIMDPEMFLLTMAGIHLEFAVVKTITAIGMGLSAGTAVLLLERFGALRHPLKAGLASGCGCDASSGQVQPEVRSRIDWRFWQSAAKRAQFRQHFLHNGGFLGKWLLLAFLLESLMIRYLPADSVAQWVGPDNALAIPLAAIVGIPAYMNGYAAIPLISGLMELGMLPGAALAFATAGAVSSLPAALAVFALVRRSVFAIYLAMGLTGSIVAGYLYQWLVVA